MTRPYRKIAAQKIGRALLPDEVVHHINGDRSDNRPENLHVCKSQGEHVAYWHGTDLVTRGEIEELILIGYSSDDIVARCGVGAHRLVRIRREFEQRAGFPLRRIGYRLGLVEMPKKKPTFDWTLACALRDDGISLAEIGRRFGVTGEAVAYAVRRARTGHVMS